MPQLTHIRSVHAQINSVGMSLTEEMLAYASGDMQGCADDAWAWVGSETGSNLQATTVLLVNGSGNDAKPYMQAEQQSTSTLSEREVLEWGGWDHVQRILNQLLQELSVPQSCADIYRVEYNSSRVAATSDHRLHGGEQEEELVPSASGVLRVRIICVRVRFH